MANMVGLNGIILRNITSENKMIDLWLLLADQIEDIDERSVGINAAKFTFWLSKKMAVANLDESGWSMLQGSFTGLAVVDS